MKSAVLGVGSGSTQFSSISQEKMKLYIDGIELGFDVEYEDREALKTLKYHQRGFCRRRTVIGLSRCALWSRDPACIYENLQVWKAVRNEISKSKPSLPRSWTSEI